MEINTTKDTLNLKCQNSLTSKRNQLEYRYITRVLKHKKINVYLNYASNEAAKQISFWILKNVAVFDF